MISVKYLDKGYVSLHDISHSVLTERSIYETIGNIATLSYGNDAAKNPHELGKKIEELGHLSVLEFIRSPVYDEQEKRCLYSSIQHSFRHRKDLFPVSSNYDMKNHRRCIATFRIKIPIFVARQLMRHRCFSFLEMSRRYVTDKKKPFEFYIPDSIDNVETIEKYYNNVTEIYNMLREQGVKPEVARTVLPVSLYTELWLQGCRECFSNFFKHRLDTSAQYEIRDLAEKMYTLLVQYQPEFVEELL